jgi:crossover junction endodeoxyribonuclease RusA
MSATTLTLTLPWPPSVNTYWRSVLIKGRPVTLLSRSARAYRKAVSDCVLQQLSGQIVPNLQTGRLSVSLECAPPDRRIRDLDNLPKGVFDACTHAGIWTDDSQIDRMTIWRMAPYGKGRVTLKVGVMP